MDDIEKIFRGRNNLLTMFNTRGYTIEENLWIESKEELKKLYYSKKLDIEIRNKGKQPIVVKWILNNKVKPNLIKETIDNIKNEYIEEDMSARSVLILKTKPNTNILKIIKEKEFKGHEIIWLNNIVFNITQHFLVPKHIKMNEEEIKKLMVDLYITNKFNLPVMYRDDPMARYLDLTSGDVCKIIRYSPTSGEYISYRVVK